MAKRQVAACIFCGDLPCTCNEKSAPKLKTSKPKAPKPVEPVRTDAPEYFAPTESNNRFAAKVVEQEKAHIDPDEAEMNEAIRILWPLLSSDTKNKYRWRVEPDLTAEQYRIKSEIRRSSDGIS